MDYSYRSAFVPHDLKAPVVGAATGPLAGFTCVVKDMYDIADERTGSGNPAILEHQPIANKPADVIQRLLDAGATITGKTICEEFFYSVTGINAHYGAPVSGAFRSCGTNAER
jgi:amidase